MLEIKVVFALRVVSVSGWSRLGLHINMLKIWLWRVNSLTEEIHGEIVDSQAT